MICVEVALKAEAGPLIEALDLKPLSGNHLFPIWENDQIKLIVSGVGKIKAGAACSYLAAIHRDEDIYGYLNVGIGGHQLHRVGTPLLIHKIIDEGRRLSFFPSFVFTPPCQTEVCLTVETPEHAYETDYVYDMEAAGFYSIASKLTPLEMIHVFKVISDNVKHPATEVNKKLVEKLIGDHVELIQKILEEMHGLIDEIAPVNIPFLDECLKNGTSPLVKHTNLETTFNDGNCSALTTSFFLRISRSRKQQRTHLRFLKTISKISPFLSHDVCLCGKGCASSPPHVESSRKASTLPSDSH
ncbi:hypothetical protein [Simkania sp.]|uniref:hypothetical protein n=1 Tax=Simkania sp. TaxID=34094 RepID=UPI003B519760